MSANAWTRTFMAELQHTILLTADIRLEHGQRNWTKFRIHWALRVIYYPFYFWWSLPHRQDQARYRSNTASLLVRKILNHLNQWKKQVNVQFSDSVSDTLPPITELLVLNCCYCGGEAGEKNAQHPEGMMFNLILDRHHDSMDFRGPQGLVWRRIQELAHIRSKLMLP